MLGEEVFRPLLTDSSYSVVSPTEDKRLATHETRFGVWIRIDHPDRNTPIHHIRLETEIRRLSTITGGQAFRGIWDREGRDRIVGGFPQLVVAETELLEGVSNGVQRRGVERR